jgi:hypothetical protein
MILILIKVTKQKPISAAIKRLIWNANIGENKMALL